MRSHIGSRLAVEVYSDYAGISDIIGVFEELLDELAAAFTDSHGAQRPVAGVGVGSQDHLAAACHHLTHVLVDNCDVRRNIDSAVLLSRGQTKHVVILVDGSAYRAQRVVAVGQNIGQREFIHSRSSRCLHDADKSNIVGSHGIKFDPKLVHIIILVMRFQN